jgi:hypothetical protein
MTFIRSRHLRVPFGVVVAAVLLISCSSPGGAVPVVATQAEATAILQNALNDSIAALPPGARMEHILLTGFPTSHCDETSDPNPTDLVFVNNSWWLRGLPLSGNSDYFRGLHDHWLAAGWSIDTDKSPQFLEVSRDGYGLSLSANAKGELSLAGSTPCVTPAPQPSSSG